MESDDNMPLLGMLTYPNHASTPIPKKRSAPVPMMNLENGSEVSAAKKKLVLECDTTPLASSRTCLSTSTLSTPGRMVSTSRIHITRGIQTIRPETTNRYCQVSVARIRKPTTTQHVQTEEWIAPPALSVNEMGCQTDGPLLLPNTCVGTTQTDSIPDRDPVQRDEASCQTDMLEEQPEEHQEQLKPVELDEPERHGTARESITNMLNDFAKQYGIDLQSPAKKKKAKSNSKKKEIEQLQECLANKTYKAMASKVDEKMGQILQQHMAQYGRETVASRERLIRWTKSFIRRQQQQNRAAASTAPSRKIVLVRKIVTPASKRPSVEDKGVQCVAEVETIRITVGTQWQRQKPMVTKKKPVSSRNTRSKAISTIKPTSTDSKTCSAGSRDSMRQTKLSSYAKELAAGENIQGRQPRQRKQQGEYSSKSPKSATVTANPSSSSSKTTNNAPPTPKPPPAPPAAKKKTRNQSKAPKETAEICIEETPPSSPPLQRSYPELERKHVPYRSPPTYPTQCSKATETSFLTPSRIRNLAPELMDNDRQPLNYITTNDNRSFNPAVLLSPLERMYVEPTTTARTNRPQYNTFLVPLQSNESVPPTPQSIVYLNPTERRVLLRSGPSNGGSVREKPPEISIITSQQLYSQIGMAVEKALKNQSLPSLANMYGEPFIEVFNGCGPVTQGAASDGLRLEEARINEQATKQQQVKKDQFVCSSGKEDANFQGSQQRFVRPPFHTERSPSLSPIVYDDENSGDEMIL